MLLTIFIIFQILLPAFLPVSAYMSTTKSVNFAFFPFPETIPRDNTLENALPR